MNASTTQGLVCPRCASPAKPGKKFCSQCGSPIDGGISSPPARFPRRSNLCHECGFENHHSDQFCKSCGGLLTFSPGDPSGDWAEETAATPSPIDGPVDPNAEGSPSPSLKHPFSPVASAESAPAPVGAETLSAPVNEPAAPVALNESAPQLKPADLQAVKWNRLGPRTIMVSGLGIGVLAGFVLFFMHRCGGAQSKQVSSASKAVVAVTAPSGVALPPVSSQKNELAGPEKGTAAASRETSTTDSPQPSPKGSTRTPENVSTNVSPLNLSSSRAPRSPIAPKADSPEVIASKGDGAFPLESVPAGRSASVVPLPAIPARVGTDALTLLSPFDAVTDASRPSSKVSQGPEAGAPADVASTLLRSTGNLEARARGGLADFSLARTLGGHRGWVTAVAFSADARLLASGSWDQTVKFWDVSSGREVQTLAPQSSGIEAHCVQPEWALAGIGDVGQVGRLVGRSHGTGASHPVEPQELTGTGEPGLLARLQPRRTPFGLGN